MFAKLLKKLEEIERRWRLSFGDDISTAKGRRSARRHLLWVDHGILRIWWTNFYPVAPGVFRSNQPSGARVAEFHEMGIKSILNLRGPNRYSFYLFEKEATEKYGIQQIDVHFSSNKLPAREVFLQLRDYFIQMPKPMVLHCKSGADRAGFVSAIYQMMIEGTPVELAQKQLGLKFLHVRMSNKGVLDYCLEKYQVANAQNPISFLDWTQTVYDPDKLLTEFKEQGFWGRFSRRVKTEV